MQIEHRTLDDAAAQGLITHQQAELLWLYLAQREQQQHLPRFKPAKSLYYLGGLIAIGAMTLFLNLGWEEFGGAGLLLITLSYAASALLMAVWMGPRPALALPGGIVAALAVALVPMAAYGALQGLGLWAAMDSGRPSAYRHYYAFVDWQWLMMELSTLAVGAVVL